MFFVHGVVLFEMKGSGTVWHSNPVTKDDAAGDGFGSILAIPWFGQVIQHVELFLAEPNAYTHWSTAWLFPGFSDATRYREPDHKRSAASISILFMGGAGVIFGGCPAALRSS